MEAVAIYDLRSFGGGQVLDVQLIDILRLCESKALDSSWRVRKVECLGVLADEVERLSEADVAVAGSELLRLAAGVYQFVWGDFEAYGPGDERPWLVVRAVDSSFYVVITDDADLLEKVKSRYSDVRPSPEDAEHL